MISWCESKDQDETVVVISCRQSVRPHADEDNRQTGTCMLCTEDEKPINDSISSYDKLPQKEPCSSFHEEDQIEKIKEFQFYVDMVKKITSPGCSPEMLNVALSSISSLFNMLSAISSLQRLHSSL